MQPLTQSQITTQCANPRRRRREMCQRCRADKQRCEPPERDWSVAREKCERCLQLGHPCGPSERVEKKPRKKRATITNEPVQLSEGLREDLSAVSARYTNDTSTEGQLHPRSDLTSRPVVAWEGSDSVATGSNVRSSSPALAPLVSSSFRDILNEGRRLLARLEDNLATLELFRLECQYCEDISAWTGHDHDVALPMTIIQSTINGLKGNAKNYMRFASRLIGQDPGSTEAEERFLQHLYSIEDKYRSTLHQDPISPFKHHNERDPFDFNSTLRCKRSLYSIQRKAGFGSPLYYLYGEILKKPLTSPCVHAGNGSEIVEDHIAASQAVTKTLAQISFEDVSMRDAVLGPHRNHKPLEGSKLPLPPCHLGARQDNPNVLFDLWQKSGCVWDRDFLNRTPVHVAAHSENLGAFHQIFEKEPLAATNSGLDCFGISPLMITACRDDLEGFMLLSKHGASDKELCRNRSILALAARNGSKKVVQHMLAELQSLQFSPLLELNEALQAGHHDVAQVFVDHFRRQSIAADNDMQIRFGIQAATKFGFHDIARQLEAMRPNLPDPQDTIDNCDAYDYEQGYLWNDANCHFSTSFDADINALSQELEDQTDDWRISQDGFTLSNLYPGVQHNIGSSFGSWGR